MARVIRRPGVFLVVMGVTFAVACAAESPTVLPEQPVQSIEVRQLEVIAEPRDAADFLLNPKPVGAGDYVSGIAVTIDVLPKEGWEIREWVGPVYDTAGNTAKITMDSTQTVVVRLTRNTGTGAATSVFTKPPGSTAIDVVAPTLVATADPTRVPNPRRSPIPAVTASSTSMPTPVPSPAPGGQQILFQDDFERGNASKWQRLNKGFTVVQDETGNYVLQGSIFEGTATVGELTWRDYALEFRGRVLKNSSSSTWDLVARVRARPSCNRYTIWFRAGESDGAQIIQQRTGGADCEVRSKSAASSVGLELNSWYLFRIEAVGPMITVDLDGRQILELRDSRPLLSGGIIFSVKEGGTVQYDDIRVVNLTVQSQATPTPTPIRTPTPTLRPISIPAADTYAGLGSDAAEARAFAEPILVAINRVPRDLRADFDADDPRWTRKNDSGVPGNSMKIEDGVIRMSVVGRFSTTTNIFRFGKDFVLQLDVRLAKGDFSAQQVIFLRKTTPYRYQINLRGLSRTWDIRRLLPEEGSTRLAEGAGDISPAGEVTRVTAVVKGDQALILFNDKPAAYIKHPSLDSAAPIDIHCVSSSEAVCEFDNVRYWDLANLPK